MKKTNRAQQSRINGAKSKGPTTEQGKAASSRNAVKHGFTSRTLLLSNESSADFQQLAEDYRQRFRPADRVENDLVMSLVSARHRLVRAWAIETALLDAELCRSARDFETRVIGWDEDMRRAYTWAAACKETGLLHIERLQSRLERSFNRALRQLLELQKLRREEELQNEPERVEPVPMESLDQPCPTMVSIPYPERVAELREKTDAVERAWRKERAGLLIRLAQQEEEAKNSPQNTSPEQDAA